MFNPGACIWAANSTVQRLFWQFSRLIQQSSVPIRFLFLSVSCTRHGNVGHRDSVGESEFPACRKEVHPRYNYPQKWPAFPKYTKCYLP